MNRVFLILLITIFYCLNLSAQSSSEVLIQLFENNQNVVNYTYSYEFYGEGENTIGKTELTNNLSFQKVSQIGDTTTISIQADSTKISNESALKDGEVGLLFAMVGLNMNVQIWGKGDSMNVLNREEVAKEVEEGIIGLSPDARKSIIMNMLEEDEELFFLKLYELNYAPLLKHAGQAVKIPNYEERDSIIDASPEQPRTSIKMVKESEALTGSYRIKNSTLSKSDPFTQENDNYTIESNGINSSVEEVLEVNKVGQIKHLEISTIQEHNGFKVKVNGNVVQEMKPMKEFLKIKIIRVE